jgi:hypothetical protein
LQSGDLKNLGTDEGGTVKVCLASSGTYMYYMAGIWGTMLIAVNKSTNKVSCTYDGE